MAPLAKQGTYTGLFGWNLSSAAHELEGGHVVTQDSYDGTFFNDDGMASCTRRHRCVRGPPTQSTAKAQPAATASSRTRTTTKSLAPGREPLTRKLGSTATIR